MTARVRVHETLVARAAIALACLAAIVSFTGRYAIDDAFIGYSVAQNLMAGAGFHFNPGDAVLTTSAPLAVPLYAALALLVRSEPATVAQATSALALLAIAYGTFEALRRSTGTPLACAATLVVLGSPTVLLLWSHESFLWIAFVLWAVVAAQRRRFALGALALAAAALCRPESVLAVVALVPFVSRTAGLRRALAFATVALTPLAVWTLYAYSTFGSTVSQSAKAKHAQLLIQGYPYLRGLIVSPAHTYAVLAGPLALLAFAFALGLYALALRGIARDAGWRLPILWAMLTTLAYVAAQMHFFAWYGLQVPALIALAAALPSLVAPSAKRLAYVLCIGLVAIHATTFARMVFVPDSHYNIDDDFVMPHLGDNAYEHLGRWLATHVAPGASVAYAEIGQLRYYSGRTIVDTIGLASAGVADHLLDHDWLWVYERYRPDIVVDEPNGWFSTTDPREAEWFARAYRPTEHLQFRDPAHTDPERDTYVIDRLVDPSAIPPPREIDRLARATMRLEEARDGFVARFEASPAGIDRVEFRLGARCRRARFQLASGTHTLASRAFAEPDSRIVRIGLATRIATRGGDYEIRVTGCSTTTLAPPRYRVDAFSPFAPLWLTTAPAAEAIDVFTAAPSETSATRSGIPRNASADANHVRVLASAGSRNAPSTNGRSKSRQKP
jgi:hypothetical protein